MITNRNLSKKDEMGYHFAYQMCVAKRSSGEKMSDIINDVVANMAPMISSTDDLRAFLEEEVSAYIEPVIISTSEELRSLVKWWDGRKGSIQTPYWNRYQQYLLSKPFWSNQAVEDIDDATDKVMNALADPSSHCHCERMGMVFGYVQSGKTAHYMGLINKAIDAGYKIIIVLSGIHNSLRSQTQTRIDEEVLGFETSIEALSKPAEEQRKNAIGVGIVHAMSTDKSFQTLTTRDSNGDISKSTIAVSMNPPYIVITKKNASVLKKLIAYFKKSQCAIQREHIKIIPEAYPALIIDDEADQASVNTRECFDDHGNLLEDFKPSTINGLIRTLLTLFEMRDYVGYTATPFANIFIPPKVEDLRYGADLFPRDFIMRIPRADQYIGAKEFFGLNDKELEIDNPAMPLYYQIKEGADFLGRGTKVDDYVGDLPSELILAIKYFLISTAVRNCRGQRNKPNSMLIHIVRFKEQQNKVKQKVTAVLDDIFSQLRYNEKGIIQELQCIWESNYLPTSAKMHSDFSKFMRDCKILAWDVVFDEIKNLAKERGIVVQSVNGDSKDSLIYKDHEGRPFNVIVIGGDKLSRGLTLEGLTISYFTRCSNMYDTLMQMGRWFGYRPGYIDLCRLFTTDVLFSYYQYISLATEDLVRQFDYMNDLELTPMQFGLRVATHPDLLLSSRDKIRSGDDVYNDFSCTRSQTRLLDRNPEIIRNNYNTVEQLVASLDMPERHRNDHYIWRGISYISIVEFFMNYKTAKNVNRVNSFYIRDYIKDQTSNGRLITWNVCLINENSKGNPNKIAGLDIGSGIVRKFEKRFDDKIADIKVLMSKDHEYIDYSQGMRDAAYNLEIGEYRNIKNRAELIRRDTRENPLLLLYPVVGTGYEPEGISTDTDDPTPVYGMAVLFPDRRGVGCHRSYKINAIAMEDGIDDMD